jgi:hypothetical protein
MQTQYDFLVSKASSQGNAFKDAEEKVEVRGNTRYCLDTLFSVLSYPLPPFSVMLCSVWNGFIHCAAHHFDLNMRCPCHHTLSSSFSPTPYRLLCSSPCPKDYAQKVRDLRRALEELRHEKEGTDAKAVRAEELEEAVRELRQGNRSLEDKISR